MKPIAVTQSTTLVWLGERQPAGLAIDGRLDTGSHTNCAWDTDIWYKMKFHAVYCFSEIVIIQSHDNVYAYRMQDTKVIVINTATNTESLCGVLKVRNVYTVEGQTYKIPCDLKCGDEVKLTVRHDKSRDWLQACIHMREIRAFQIAGIVKCNDFYDQQSF